MGELTTSSSSADRQIPRRLGVLSGLTALGMLIVMSVLAGGSSRHGCISAIVLRLPALGTTGPGSTMGRGSRFRDRRLRVQGSGYRTAIAGLAVRLAGHLGADRRNHRGRRLAGWVLPRNGHRPRRPSRWRGRCETRSERPREAVQLPALCRPSARQQPQANSGTRRLLREAVFIISRARRHGALTARVLVAVH